MSRKDYESAFRSELLSHGVERVRFAYGRRHSALSFEWQGRTVTFRFPGSGSDHRGIANAICDLRKLLGVKRVSNKSSTSVARRGRKSNPVRRVEPPDAPIVKQDPFAILRSLLPPSAESVEPTTDAPQVAPSPGATDTT